MLFSLSSVLLLLSILNMICLQVRWVVESSNARINNGNTLTMYYQLTTFHTLGTTSEQFVLCQTSFRLISQNPHHKMKTLQPKGFTYPIRKKTTCSSMFWRMALTEEVSSRSPLIMLRVWKTSHSQKKTSQISRVVATNFASALATSKSILRGKQTYLFIERTQA